MRLLVLLSGRHVLGCLSGWRPDWGYLTGARYCSCCWRGNCKFPRAEVRWCSMKFRIEDKKGKALSPWFDDLLEAMDATKTAPAGTRLVRSDRVVMSMKPGNYMESKADLKAVRRQNRKAQGLREEEE